MTFPMGSDDVFAHLKAQIIEDCISAIARRDAGPDGGVPSQPRPDGCELLSDSEYLDAYTAGIRKGNQERRDRLLKGLGDST